MAKRGHRLWQRLLMALLCVVLAAALLPAPVSASSGSSSSGSGSGGSSSTDTSDTSGTEKDEPPSILAPSGEGLYRPEEEPLAEAVCLVNEDTGLVVYEKNADTPLETASLVKMMTCILTIEHMERFGKDLDETLVDSTDKGWVYDDIATFRQETGTEPSTADIRRGEVLSVRELLYAALLPSANEAALLLADLVCGGYLPNFMYMMNTRAKTLGCTGTVFDDACGLSDQNMTTARDMAKITREFMRYPQLVEIAAAGSYEMEAHERHTNPYYIHNTNRLLVQSSPYHGQYKAVATALVAGKTGSLGEWQNFASKATKNGESYICVVLHSPNEADPVAPKQDPPSSPRPALCESAALYAWAFEKLTVTSALDTTQPVTELRVRYSSERDTVRLMPNDDIKAVLPSDAGESLLRRMYDLPEAVMAPISEGTVMGSITLYIGSHAVGSTELWVAADVQRNETLFMLSRVGDFFKGTFFRVLIVLVLVAALLYAGAVLLVHQSRTRQKQAAPASRQPQGKRPSGGAGANAPPRQTTRQSRAQSGQAGTAGKGETQNTARRAGTRRSGEENNPQKRRR